MVFYLAGFHLGFQQKARIHGAGIHFGIHQKRNVSGDAQAICILKTQMGAILR